MLRASGDMNMNIHYLPVARKLSRYWTEGERKTLSCYCVEVLNKTLNGWLSNGLEINANGEAIKTIGVCAIPDDVNKLLPLKTETRYRAALLYAFGCSGQEASWVCGEFQSDVKHHNTLQDSLQAVGILFSRESCTASDADAREALNMVMRLISDGEVNNNDLVLAVIALGEIGAQAFGTNDSIIHEAMHVIEEIPSIYSSQTVLYSTKARGIAGRLLQGNPLSDDDELYLLSLLSDS